MKKSIKITFYILSIFIIILDRLTKLAAEYFLKDLDRPKVIIAGFLNFIYSTNKGALFGMFNSLSNPTRFILLTILPAGIVIVVLFMLIKSDAKEFLLNTGLSMILGGAIGNLIDRILYREVIDFIDFHIYDYHWHTFNFSDAFISLGIAIILFQLIFTKSEKD